MEVHPICKGYGGKKQGHGKDGARTEKISKRLKE
jgi:hypothetical protein